MEIILNEYGLATLLGLVAFVTFWIMNFFSYTLKHKTYDEALAEVTKKNDPKSPTKNKKLKKSQTKQENVTDESDQKRKRKNSQPNSKMRRVDSLKNEHVIFADEINPEEDEKFSPTIPTEEPEVEGILQNKEEVPNVKSVIETTELNSFVDTQPLDDLQLIRRKSIQMTPTGSRANSNRGSRTDLSNIGNDESFQEAAPERNRILTFSDKKEEISAAAEITSVKQICKILKKIELSETESNTIIEMLLRKEENSEWQQNTPNKGKPNILSKLKKENEEKQIQLDESRDTINSLQSKLKQLRAEFIEEKSSLAKENERLKSSSEDQHLKKEVERLKGRLATEDKSLSDRLKTEEEENQRLNKSIVELQKVIEAALKKIYPDLNSKELCDEHEQLLEKFVSKMNKNND